MALQHWTQLHQARVIDSYIDDGVSGTLSFDKRPEGKRLLDDLSSKRFEAVVAFRVDRLARSMAVLLDLFDRLDPQRIAIRSATEPFDTSTPFGRFLFLVPGFHGRVQRGHNHGPIDAGPIPFGYMVTAQGTLTPSTRVIAGIDLTEAKAVQHVFAMVASGGTMVQACA
jgi:site-specific DNA recombinase